MKNRVLFSLILALTLGLTQNAFCSESKSAKATLVSEEFEINLVNSVNPKLIYTFYDTTIFVSPPVVSGSSFISITTNVLDYTGQIFMPGDSLEVDLDVVLVSSEKPFYPEEIEIKQKVLRGNILNLSLEPTIISTKGMFYFTPYKTLEIWNISDFNNLKRRWLNEFDSPDTSVSQISKDDIPVSNIPDNYGEYLETLPFDDRERELHEVYVPGLAYAVLMKALPQDTLDKYKGTDGYEVMPTAEDSAEVQAALIKVTRTFRGRVNGKLVHMKTNDVGVRVEVPLSGLEIRLKEKDAGGLFDQTFGTTITNQNGEFYFEYDEEQSFFEGKDIDLYLQVISRNKTYEIHASNVIGTNYKKTLWKANGAGQWFYAEGMRFELNNTSDIDPYSATHWAYNGFKYFEQNGEPLGKSLRIDVFFGGDNAGSFFNPYAFRPTLKITDDAGEDENTIYHEFGHYAQYRLQDNEFRLPKGIYGNGFEHYWSRSNTTRLAWIEGWANAVQFILDAAYWEEDMEYGFDIGTPTEVREPWFSWTTNTPNSWNITNGFQSEYYIACAIYDLWDGAGKGLPNTIPNTDDHGFDDSGQDNATGWVTIDDIELSLSEICKPLRDLKKGITHAGYYYNALKRGVSNADCGKRDGIKRAFQENRVVWNIGEYYWGWNPTTTSTDQIFISDYLVESGKAPLLGWETWTSAFDINFYNRFEFNEFHHPRYINDNTVNEAISDDYWLGIWAGEGSEFNKVSHLYLNSGKHFNIPTANYYTCSNNEIIVENGRLVLGGPNNTANLTVSAGSTLHIRENGILILRNNSSLTIEPGATLIYDAGATIILEDEEDVLDIKGDLLIGFNANFTFTGNGFVRFSGNDGASENITFRTNSSMSFNGNGQHDKVVEIIQNTLYVPDYNRFVAENGRIELASNSRLAVGGALKLENVKFTSLTGDRNDHRGLHVFGHLDVSINNCHFEHGFTGIQGELMYNHGAPLNVTNSTFYNNYVGVYHIAKSVNLRECNFYYNDLGIYSTAMDFVGTVANCSFGDNIKDIGTIGDAPSGINISNSYFADAKEYSILSAGGHTTTIRCSDFYNNVIPISSTLGNRLNMSNFFVGGNNYFTGNQGVAVFDLAEMPMLGTGRNDWSWQNRVQFIGNISTNRTSVAAMRNKWGNGLINRPRQGSNYVLTNSNNELMNMQDIFPTSSKGNCNIVVVDTPCELSVFNGLEKGDRVGLDAACVIPDLARCLTCDVIQLPQLPAVQINLAATVALNNLETARNLSDTLNALDMLADILSAPLINPDQGDYGVLKLAYDVLMKGLSALVEVNVGVELPNVVESRINAAIDLLHGIELKNSTHPFVSDVNLAVTKAELYRLIEEREQALITLHTVDRSNFSGAEDNYLQTWICAIEHEVNMLADTTSKRYAQPLLLCENNLLAIGLKDAPTVAQVEESILADVGGADMFDVKETVLAPNPIPNGQGEITLTSHGVASITLTDVNGAVIKKFNHNFDHQMEFSVDVSEIEAGVYFAIVNGSESTSTIRFVKL